MSLQPESSEDQSPSDSCLDVPLELVSAALKHRLDFEDVEASRERCRSLAGFVREAWHVVEPSAPYVHGWHIDAIAEHLQAISLGQITRLLINICPGSSKSLLTSVLFPAWEWGPARRQSEQYITTSYSGKLVVRDNMRMRRLVASDWFQARWPLVMRADSDNKMRFENDRGGVREGFAFGSLTGGRATRVVIDDPHSTETAESEAERETSTRIFRESVPLRLNDPITSAIIVMMQRLHAGDISGVIEKLGLDYTRLVIPMEFEAGNRCTTSIGWRDPRIYDGELMCPERFPREVVDRDKSILGPYGAAAQFQQRPTPRGGGMFKREWFEIVDALPAGVRSVRAWDLASIEGGGDWTVGLKMATDDKGTWWITDVRRGQWGPTAVENAIVATASADGVVTPISLPQDPGQAGKPVWEAEPVLMADGSIRALAEIEIGDHVIGGDGDPHPVTAVYQQGNLDCLALLTESGRRVAAAKDHPFLTPDGWVGCGDLVTGDVLGLLSRPRIAASNGRSREEYRLAGYFVGDGSVGRKAGAGPDGSCDSGFVCFDPVELQDFRHCVESLGGEVVRRKREGVYGAKGLQGWLRDTGLAGHTAYTKRVPEWVFRGPHGHVADFLGAYFACDGTISKRADGAVFYSVALGLLEDVRHLLLRLGISSTIKRKNGMYLLTRHESWLLRVKQQDDGLGRFARRIPIYNEAKRERLAKMLEVARFRRFDEAHLPDRIVGISEAGLLPCRCITVEGSESFTVRDLTVHNSQIRYLISRLAGYVVHSSPETGSKEMRANPVASQAGAGNVKLLRGQWNAAFLDEVEIFPNGDYDDEVDAMSRAFSRLVTRVVDSGFAAPRVLSGGRG